MKDVPRDQVEILMNAFVQGRADHLLLLIGVVLEERPIAAVCRELERSRNWGSAIVRRWEEWVRQAGAGAPGVIARKRGAA